MLSYISTVCYARRLIQTGIGLLRFVPKRSEIGDHVTVLLGARVPMIVRDNGPIYKVVGER